MSNTWDGLLKNSFESLKNLMESLTKPGTLGEGRKGSKISSKIRDFILAFNGENVKERCSKMLTNFLSDEENIKALKKGIIIKKGEDAIVGDIFVGSSQCPSILTIVSSEGEERTCNLKKIEPFFNYLNVGERQKPVNEYERKERENLQEIKKTYKYFLYSFAKAIGQYCFNTHIPDKETAIEIFNNNSLPITDIPKPNSMVGTALSFFESLGENDVIAEAVTAVGGGKILNTIKSLAKSADSEKIVQAIGEARKGFTGGDTSSVISSVSDIISSLSENVKVDEGCEASEQSF